MIKRYTPEEIGAAWSELAKFTSWLKVELAVVQARSNLNIPGYTPQLYEQIKTGARFDVGDIYRVDKLIEHDLEAFVEVVRQSLPPELRKCIHDGLTSYDIEVPALALQLKTIRKIILLDLRKLIDVIRNLASLHQWTYCIGMTHGQDAKPTTLGWRLCAYLEQFETGAKKLSDVFDDIERVKCSGAVGNYMTISPEVEREVCKILDLKVRPAATQIVGRDVFARLLSEIATIGGVIEKMATDLRFLASSAVGEVREPRKVKQKGSSAMPHKRNPVLLERLSGMAIILRGYAVMGQELNRTWLERDIAHSSVERIALPDATILLDYMLQKLTWVVENLDVNRERMAENINRSLGCWASEEVKVFLCSLGYDSDVVYTFIQQCAFNALDRSQPFLQVLLGSVFPPSGTYLRMTINESGLSTLFDFVSKLQDLRQAYARMGLDASKALEPNI